jgi:kynurenine 3-monooxygenase
MNAAFEDCTVLNECLQEFGPREAAFRAFENRRKENTDVLADLCVQNYIEMRDKVSSPWFLLHKKFDILLSKLFPGIYLPLYGMVSFSRIPYAKALRRAKLQDWLVRGAIIIIVFLIFMIILLASRER